MPSARPDVALIGPEWPTRALVRAQLIEEGHEVVASDGWPIPRAYLRHGTKPRVMVVDLHGLPEPQSALDEIRILFKPSCVLVLSALGTIDASALDAMGFQVLSRPAAVGEIAEHVKVMLDRCL